MSDNRTTELLCTLLEERGLSCQMNYLHVFWYVGPKLYDAMDNLDGTLTVDNLTPEQAVIATLGSEVNDGAHAERTCRLRMTTVGWGCSACHVVSWTTDSKPKPNYCPSCGARVVE